MGAPLQLPPHTMAPEVLELSHFNLGFSANTAITDQIATLSASQLITTHWDTTPVVAMALRSAYLAGRIQLTTV